MIYDTLTDTELVAAAADGDRDAWVEIVNRYASLVLAICRQFRLQSAECDDVMQTVWLGLVEGLTRLREPAALPGWLATTTRRECLRQVERDRHRQCRERPADDDIADDDDLNPAEEIVVATELAAALRVAFAQLKPACQQLIVLLMQDPRLPYVEIAARLGRPVGSLGPQRARCLGKLRSSRALAAWFGDEEGRAW